MKLTAKCVANVWCLFEDEALIAIVAGDDQDVDYEQKAKRITACVNACAGITTETLEAGVVVVPVEEYRYLVGTLEEYDEVEAQMGNYSEIRSELLRRANARLQQNGGADHD